MGGYIMALSNKFNEALNDKNYRLIKIMMENSMLVDSSFRDFNEMDAVVSTIPGFYEKHDDGELEQDKTQWNEDYLARLTVQTTKNFSHERVNHLKEVVRYLRPPAKQNVFIDSKKTISDNSGRRPIRAAGNGQSEYQRQKAIDQANGNFRPQKIAVGAVIGAAAGAGIMAVASGPVMLGAIGGAAIGVITVAAATSGEK
jgi:hypothetical protein